MVRDGPAGQRVLHSRGDRGSEPSISQRFLTRSLISTTVRSGKRYLRIKQRGGRYSLLSSESKEFYDSISHVFYDYEHNLGCVHNCNVWDPGLVF